MLRSVIIACSALLIGTLQSPRAAAEDARPSAVSIEQQVRTIDHNAQDALRAKDFERARSLWLKALSLQPSAGVALSLGRLDLELKRYRDSAEHIDLALRTLSDTASEDTRALAKKALAEAKAQIAVVHATSNRPGADMVGMSTVHEVIVARHMGIEVLGISLVTNAAAGVLNEPIHHEEVMEMGRRVERQFTGLVTALVPQIAAVS